MASNSNKSKCYKCGARDILLELSGILVCTKCYLIHNPPVLRLDQYEDDPDLWNRTQSKRELIMVLKDFLRCGWFLRKVEEHDSKVPKFSIRKMSLEYYGECKCIRFLGYYRNLSLVHLDDCKNPHGSCKRHPMKLNETNLNERGDYRD